MPVFNVSDVQRVSFELQAPWVCMYSTRTVHTCNRYSIYSTCELHYLCSIAFAFSHCTTCNYFIEHSARVVRLALLVRLTAHRSRQLDSTRPGPGAPAASSSRTRAPSRSSTAAWRSSCAPTRYFRSRPSRTRTARRRLPTFLPPSRSPPTGPTTFKVCTTHLHPIALRTGAIHSPDHSSIRSLTIVFNVSSKFSFSS